MIFEGLLGEGGKAKASLVYGTQFSKTGRKSDVLLRVLSGWVLAVQVGNEEWLADIERSSYDYDRIR